MGIAGIVGGIDRRLSVAPMMARTDRHCRYFLRQVSARTLLYSEMITADAVRLGDRARLLAFDAAEHPVGLQLGGSEPDALARAAQIGQAFDYDEINLNIGCPSPRVRDGRFGRGPHGDARSGGRLRPGDDPGGRYSRHRQVPHRSRAERARGAR